jgi:two-component system response regulator
MYKKNNSPRPFNVLLVEDSDDDVLLTKHAFAATSVPIDFQIARDGIEALAVMRNEPPYESAPRPDMVIFDLNMPRMDGRQLLAEIKRDDRLKQIPTMILTTSAADDDVCEAYRQYASAYMTKPIEMSEFNRRILRFVDFWLSDVIVLPRQQSKPAPPIAART